MAFYKPPFRKTVSASRHRPQLIVFGRYPRVGTTKTRLIPLLGPAGAAALQKWITEQTVAKAVESSKSNNARLTFCHDGGDRRQMLHWLGTGTIKYVPQTCGDLGRRMFQAMQAAFGQGARRVVLVGTDIPGITVDILNSAFDQLHQKDLVLGPSTDGGYWLVGMSRLEDIFSGIAWSQPDVRHRTLALASRKGMTFALLDPLSDLDTPDDLAREMGSRSWPTPYLSVVIPALNEELQIAGAISAAESVDAEIIVSDGGSADRTLEIARSMGTRTISGRKGRAVQQNRGAGIAIGQILLFLHADTRLPADYIDHVFETLMDRRTVLGAFRFATDMDTPAMRWITFWANQRSEHLQLPYGDQGLFLRRTDFSEIGGFPDVPIAEDLYLARRLRRNGRIALARANAITSGRRWQRLGPLRTTIVNTIIAACCLAGASPSRLASLYKLPPVRTLDE